MNRIVLVDLGDKELLSRVSALTGPGGIRELGRALAADSWEGETVSLPLRLLIIDPRSKVAHLCERVVVAKGRQEQEVQLRAPPS